MTFCFRKVYIIRGWLQQKCDSLSYLNKWRYSSWDRTWSCTPSSKIRQEYHTIIWFFFYCFFHHSWRFVVWLRWPPLCSWFSSYFYTDNVFQYILDYNDICKRRLLIIYGAYMVYFIKVSWVLLFTFLCVFWVMCLFYSSLVLVVVSFGYHSLVNVFFFGKCRHHIWRFGIKLRGITLFLCLGLLCLWSLAHFVFHLLMVQRYLCFMHIKVILKPMKFHDWLPKLLKVIDNFCYLKVDVQSLKDAIRSAADVMQAMASLIRSLVTKVCWNSFEPLSPLFSCETLDALIGITR